MDFELTDLQKKIQNSVREFIRSEFDKDKIRDWDQTHTFPREMWKKAAHSGFIGIHFPQEYGGRGTGIMENILVVEEFCRGDSGVGVALSLADFSSEVILRFGTPDQKKKFQPMMGMMHGDRMGMHGGSGMGMMHGCGMGMKDDMGRMMGDGMGSMMKCGCGMMGSMGHGDQTEPPKKGTAPTSGHQH